MKTEQTKTNIEKLSIIAGALIFAFICFPAITQAKEINQENVVNLVNESRLENNLKPLFINPDLSQIARSKAQDMIKNHYFSHTSPDGVNPWYWFSQNNYSYKYAGENLAINYDNAEEEHEAWMKSPTHRKNILNHNFTEIGIATASGIIEGKKSDITVQVFATPQAKVLSFENPLSSKSKNTYILGAQSSKIEEKFPISGINLDKKTPLYEVIDANNKLISVAKSQSDKIILTIAIMILLIISRDMALNSIYAKTIHHKYSMANLILFLVLFSIFF